MRNCFILGSGRCGTSALAGALAHSGAFTGYHTLGPTPTMPKGYFEDRWFNDWNNDLLSQVCPYEGLFRAPIPLTIDCGQMRLHDPRAQRSFWFAPYALKDPRFAFTYPVWRDRYIQRPHVNLVLYRNPSDFVASALRLRQDYPVIASDPAALEAMWANSYEHVLRNHDDSFYYIDYAEVVDGSILRWLEGLLGYPIQRDFIRPNMARSSGALCPEKLRPLYEELQARSMRRDIPLESTA
jgi:hypothetical protein